MSYNTDTVTSRSLENNEFYRKIMTWLAVSFGAASAGVFLIGPKIPQSMIMPLGIVAIVALIAASFSRKAMKLSGLFAIVIPVILGITLYPTLNYYVNNGMGNIVGIAAAGTAIIFGLMAILGWTSKVSLNKWGPKLFILLIGIIAISLLNAFIFKLTILSLVISIAVVIVFSIYTFIDIQAIRDRSPSDQIPASFYALNIFLDIYNIFVSLLNILGILSKD